MKSRFIELRENSAHIFLGATKNGQLVGSVMGVVCDELYGECKPFLVVENMVVDSAHRQKGIGKLLFKELERQAKTKGCAQIILVTEEDRKDSCVFYESIGFSPLKNKGYKKKLI